MIPGMQNCNVAISLRVEVALPDDWRACCRRLRPATATSVSIGSCTGQSEVGGIARFVLSNFHFLGVARAGYKMGDALVVDVGCYVDTIQEDPGNGILYSPVIPPAFAVL